jgi:hypothetical protein
MENIMHHGISWLYIGKATWTLRLGIDTFFPILIM